MPRRKRDLNIRFWSKVKKTDNCWIWIGSARGKGYGGFTYKSKAVYAHRFSWFLTYGYFSNIQICHKCDNPLCVRPDHLFEGTAFDNMRDAEKKGRLSSHPRHYYMKDKRLQYLKYLQSIGI